MKSKILLSSFIYSLIGILMLLQTNIVLAIASDPDNPITAAITSAINGNPSPSPEASSIPSPSPTPEPSQAPISAPIANPTSTPTASPIPTATPTPVPTQNNTQYDLGVLVLKYFPLTANGQNIDATVTGDVGNPYQQIRQRTIDVTNNLLSVLPKASSYLGYKDASASSSLNYHIVDTKEFTTAVPTIDITKVNRLRYPDYRNILSDQNICNYVDNQNVREVWLWAYQGPAKADGQPYLNISESKMSSPYGDISNSPRYNDMPVCQHTYRVYTFNYQRGTAEALESWGHQMESELDAYDSYLFRNKFQGPAHPQTSGVTGRCGSVHNPPNARSEYDRGNPTPQNSDCLDWNPDGMGTLSSISCQNWGCNGVSDNDNPSLNYMIWNWQNLPGKNNQKAYKGAILRNLWDIHGDFDNVMSSLLPIVNAPMVIKPVVNNVFPNPATQGTLVTLTGSGFTNSSKVYVSGGLMPVQSYQVSDDGTTLKFILSTESTFVSGQTYGLQVINGQVQSYPSSITIAPSVIQTIPEVSSKQRLVAPAVTLDADHPEVVLASSNFNTTITVPSSVSNPTINFANLLTTTQNSATAIFNNIINITGATSLGDIAIQIPTLTTITGPSSWNGIINAPRLLGNTSGNPVADSGTSATTSSVMEVGFGDMPLTFDNAVRILIPGQAGKLIGFQRGDIFTKITQSCDTDSQVYANNMPAGGNCYISVGNDLVIWTKHFTKFVTYTQSSNSTSSSSSSSSGGSSNSNSGSSSNAPVCGDTKPQSAPKLLSAKVTGRNEVTLTWSKAQDPVTYYLITYGTKPNKPEYGNPNVGGKDTTSYVVRGLNNNQTYYFKVRAGNNCTPGELSNEIAVKASGDNISSPAAGFKAGVLSQNQKASTGAGLKFRQITFANPQRILGSGNMFTKFISFVTHFFGK